MMKQLAWWMRGVQRMLSVLTLVRLSALSLITSSDKLAKYAPDKWAGRWTENWLNGQAQRVVISGTSPTGGQTIVVYPWVDTRANIV